MPAAEMMSGTIIGEIRMAMIARRKGTWDCERPIAASVPKLTESKVAAGAMVTEFQSDFCQSEFVRKSR